MAKLHLSGSWAGSYSYDASDALPMPPPSVKFTLQAQPGWFGRIKGTIQDDHLEEATIEGWKWGTLISFCKRYPQMYVLHDDKSITLTEFLATKDAVAFPDQPAPSQIWYRGEYDTFEELVTGTWLINACQMPVRIGGNAGALRFKKITGTWKMRRDGR